MCRRSSRLGSDSSTPNAVTRPTATLFGVVGHRAAKGAEHEHREDGEYERKLHQSCAAFAAGRVRIVRFAALRPASRQGPPTGVPDHSSTNDQGAPPSQHPESPRRERPRGVPEQSRWHRHRRHQIARRREPQRNDDCRHCEQRPQR
jgi:hypothetical protein